MKVLQMQIYALLFAGAFLLAGCTSQSQARQRYVFFLHNKFLEVAGKDAQHPEYGRCEYDAIISTFRNAGFVVISEIRPAGTDAKVYAQKVAKSIDSLIRKGVIASDITVVGTSKGCYIARFVSGRLRNNDLNFVLVGCCLEEDSATFRDVKLYGHILSIYERSDVLGQSCNSMIQRSASVPTYSEIALRSDAAHGFLYKASDLWLIPAISWANRYHRFVQSSPYYDSVMAMLEDKSYRPFNGVFLVAQNGATRFLHCSGESRPGQPLRINDRFKIGSISKQITAVLVLRAVDKGRLQLHVPIRQYLRGLKQPWAKEVTIHHLLTHTHGLIEPDMFHYLAPEQIADRVMFAPGRGFAYSQIGYALLAAILSQVEGRSFEILAADLFKLCNMSSTVASGLPVEDSVVSGYRITPEGDREVEKRSLPQGFLAAGGFISTANDLLLWNEQLHNGRLLMDHSYRLMMSKHPGAVRKHPLFDTTYYGYGITVAESSGFNRLGQTGGVPGFASMSFYYPESKTSVIMLSNEVLDFNSGMAATFRFHTELVRITEGSDLLKRFR